MKRAAERLSYDAATASISRTHSQCQREGRTPRVRMGEPIRRSGLHTWRIFVPLCVNTRVNTRNGGASRDRTGDLKLAKLALSQLSYGPVAQPEWSECSHSPWAAANQSPRQPGVAMVGRVGVEPTTSRLSGVRSNHLSYRPPCQPEPQGPQAAGCQLRFADAVSPRQRFQDEGT